MNLNAHHLVLLTALRDASALRREPGPLTPDGRESWFTLRQLEDEDRLGGLPRALLDPSARTLYKRHLVLRRTLSTRLFYCLSDEGRALLEGIEARAGVTALTAADRGLEQARFDLALARRRELAALRELGKVVNSGVVRLTAAELALMSEEAYR